MPKRPHTHAGEVTVSATPHITREKVPVLLYALLAIYVLLVVWGISNHEQWRDEAQAWLIVRDTSFTELWSILRTEGHPPLWYLLIIPLVKTGMPYETQNWLSAAIMTGAVYLLLFRTNLPVIVKILLPFSFFFLYEYAFFARSYSLIAFFSSAIISLYPVRFEKPWLYALCIVGLFNAHVLVFTFCGMLLVLYVWDIYDQKLKDKRIWATAIFMAVGGGYLLPYLFFAKMSDEFARGIDDNWGRIAMSINNGISIGQSDILAILLLLSVAVLLVRSKKALLLLIGGLVSVFYILGFKYFAAGMRHQGVIFFVLLVAVSIAAIYNPGEKKKGGMNITPAQWVLIAILFLQLKPSFEYYINDVQNTFSGAKDAAEYLEDNNLDNRIIVGHQAWAASALLPFMDKNTKMFYGECERYGTYYVYDSCFIQDKWQYAVETTVDAAYKNFKGRLDSLVLVFNYPANPKALQFLDLVYSSPEPPIIKDEAFYIYKFKDGVK